MFDLQWALVNVFLFYSPTYRVLVILLWLGSQNKYLKIIKFAAFQKHSNFESTSLGRLESFETVLALASVCVQHGFPKPHIIYIVGLSYHFTHSFFLPFLPISLSLFLFRRNNPIDFIEGSKVVGMQKKCWSEFERNGPGGSDKFRSFSVNKWLSAVMNKKFSLFSLVHHNGSGLVFAFVWFW